jgi:4-oxalocrotonate tautomerase
VPPDDGFGVPRWSIPSSVYEAYLPHSLIKHAAEGAIVCSAKNVAEGVMPDNVKMGIDERRKCLRPMAPRYAVVRADFARTAFHAQQLRDLCTLLPSKAAIMPSGLREADPRDWRVTRLPLSTVEALAGRTPEQKRGLVKDMTEAVMKNFNVGPEAITIIIHELSDEHLAKAGKL